LAIRLDLNALALGSDLLYRAGPVGKGVCIRLTMVSPVCNTLVGMLAQVGVRGALPDVCSVNAPGGSAYDLFFLRSVTGARVCQFAMMGLSVISPDLLRQNPI
jgi:hypothetical protein